MAGYQKAGEKEILILFNITRISTSKTVTTSIGPYYDPFERAVPKYKQRIENITLASGRIHL